jgi:DGQHR domain-containing protein
MRVPALNLSRKGIGFYLTAMSAEAAFRISRVERVNANPAEGFQRALDSQRAKKIAKYHQSKVIPGAIILSSENEEDVKYDPTAKEVQISDREGALLVIDGQHRLYGAALASQSGEKDLLIPVCILTNLSLVDQVQYFVDVNSTQKGVPRTLRIELTKFLVEPESIDDIRLRLFRDLNQDTDSVLLGKLSAEQKGPGYLSHVPFEVAVNRVLSVDRMRDLPYDGKKLLLKNYLAGIYENLIEADSSGKLTQSAFFQAIFRIFEKICEEALVAGKNYKRESFVQAFEFLQSINFEFHTGTNEDSITNLEKDFLDKLSIQRRTRSQEGLF